MREDNREWSRVKVMGHKRHHGVRKQEEEYRRDKEREEEWDEEKQEKENKI